jgi:hypothetical protein
MPGRRAVTLGTTWTRQPLVSAQSAYLTRSSNSRRRKCETNRYATKKTRLTLIPEMVLGFKPAPRLEQVDDEHSDAMILSASTGSENSEVAALATGRTGAVRSKTASRPAGVPLVTNPRDPAYPNAIQPSKNQAIVLLKAALLVDLRCRMLS